MGEGLALAPLTLAPLTLQIKVTGASGRPGTFSHVANMRPPHHEEPSPRRRRPHGSRPPKLRSLRHSCEQNIQIDTRGRHTEISNRKRYQNRVFKNKHSPHIIDLKLLCSGEAMRIRNYLRGNGCRAAAGLRARTHGACVHVRACVCVCACVCARTRVCVCVCTRLHVCIRRQMPAR